MVAPFLRLGSNNFVMLMGDPQMKHPLPPARRSLLPAVLAAATFLFGSAAIAADSWDAPDAKWRSGPVKWLLSREEDQAFKKFKTDEERTAFVEEFWAKRDPSAGTPENEYRVAFYKLAREAAEQFSEDGGKGWQDDRGRVFILFGPPDEHTEDTSSLGSAGSSAPDRPSATPGGYGSETRPEVTSKTLRWVYLRDPIAGKKERLELEFSGDTGGGYRLRGKIDWEHPFLKGLMHTPPPAAATKVPAPSSSAAMPTPPPPVAPVVAVPPPVESTPQSELMQMVRASTDAQSAIPLDVTINYYKAAKGTFTTLTLLAKKAALPEGTDPASQILSAEIFDVETGASVQRFFKADSFGGFAGNASAGPADTLMYQAERPLTPGKYKAIFAMKDPVSGTLGKLEREILVPSFETGEFQLSTVTLARKIEPLATPPAADKLVPFVLGAFTVVPRSENLYKDGDEIAFYYQVYGATTDPVTNVAKLDLSYAFEKNFAGQWRMVGGRPVLTPGQPGLVQAFSLPLRGWPAGDYRLSIKVSDTLANPQKQALAEIPFKVVANPDASKAKSKSKGS